MITGTRYRLTQEIHRQTQLARDIQRGMVEISTGKKIQVASDDPVGAARVSDIARLQANMATWKRNLQSAAALSARADDALGAAASAVTRVNELMVAAATGTMSEANRATVALELRSIAEEMAVLQDTRDSRGERVFPTGEVLRIPVGPDVAIAAVGTRSSAFDIETAGGPKNLADLISDAADAISLSDPAARTAAVNAALDEVEAAVTGISAAQGEQGARGKRIDTMLEGLEESALVATDERVALESTDITEVIARLEARQLTLEAAQAAFVRINGSSLFELLR